MVITRSPPMTRQRTLNMRFGETQQQQRSDAALEELPAQQNPISPTHGDPPNPDLDDNRSDVDRNSDQQIRDQLLQIDMERLQANGNVANGGEDGGSGGNVSGHQQPVGGAEQQIDSLTGLGLGLPPPAQPPLESTPQSDDQHAFFGNMVGTAAQQQSLGLFTRAGTTQGRQSIAQPIGNPNLQFAMAATALQQQSLGPFPHAHFHQPPPIGNTNLNFAASATAYQKQMVYHQQPAYTNPAPTAYQQVATQPSFNAFPNPPPGFMWNLVPLNTNVGQNIQPVGYGVANSHRSTSQQRQQRPWPDDDPDEFRDDGRQRGRESAREMHRVHFDDHRNTRFESEIRGQNNFSAQAVKSLDSFSYSMTMNTLPNLKGTIGIDAVKGFFKQFDVATEEWPDRKRLTALESKCSGRAERAFNAAVANSPYRYESIKRAMIQQLEETDAKQMGAFDELMAGVQRRATESIDDLADRVAALVHRAYPGLTQHLYDEYSIKHLIRSLGNPELALCLELNRREGCSLDEFVALAARAEATQRAARNTTRFWSNTPKNVNQFAPSNHPNRTEIVCYNCGTPGHLSRHCEAARRDHQGPVGQNYNMNPPNMGANWTPFSSGNNGQQNFGQNNPQLPSRNILRQNFLVEQDVTPPVRDGLFAGALNTDLSSELSELFKSNKDGKGSAKFNCVNGSSIGNLMMVKVSVCGESTSAMLDGGAQISLISAEFFLRLVREGKVDKSAIGVSDSGRRVVDINGQSVDYFGIVSVPVSRGSQFARIRMHVTKAPFGYDVLFGTNAFEQLGFKLFDVINQKVIDFGGVGSDESSPETAHVIYSVKVSPSIGPCGRKMAALVPNFEPSCATMEEHKKARKSEKRKRQRERRKLKKVENWRSNSGKREEEKRRNGKWEEDSGIVTNRLRTIEFSGGGVKARMSTKPDDREGVRIVRWKSPFTRGKAGLSLGDCPRQKDVLNLGDHPLPNSASRRSGMGLDDRPCPVRQCMSKAGAKDLVERVSVRGASVTRLCSPPTFRMPNRVWKPNRVT